MSIESGPGMIGWDTGGKARRLRAIYAVVVETAYRGVLLILLHELVTHFLPSQPPLPPKKTHLL